MLADKARRIERDGWGKAGKPKRGEGEDWGLADKDGGWVLLGKIREVR